MPPFLFLMFGWLVGWLWSWKSPIVSSPLHCIFEMYFTTYRFDWVDVLDVWGLSFEVGLGKGAVHWVFIAFACLFCSSVFAFCSHNFFFKRDVILLLTVLLLSKHDWFLFHHLVKSVSARFLGCKGKVRGYVFFSSYNDLSVWDFPHPSPLSFIVVHHSLILFPFPSVLWWLMLNLVKPSLISAGDISDFSLEYPRAE